MNTLLDLAYLATSVCFIGGIMLLRSPATARAGNLLSALGMAIALVATAAVNGLGNLGLLLGAVVVGAVIGVVSAQRVAMTAMPQMVALFNGMGGGAAALISVGEAIHGADTSTFALILGFLTILIGFVSFAGSLVAFAKLQEILTGRPITFPLQKPLNGLVFLILLALGAYSVAAGVIGGTPLGIFALGSLLLGILIVLPIGGADMPVVISLLNSFTGLAAAATGFLLGNNALIVAGTLVGASGFILTQLMSRAMNRPLTNVLFGAFGKAQAGATDVGERNMRVATPEDVALLAGYADSVIIVPGYGLAVAQAQHQLKNVATLLEQRGVDVRYAIHPVAGRMPGHMNVLLAEADVPYDKLYDLDQINDDFERTDVAIVVGANDVVNPAARDTPGSPIYGMPILNVDKAKNVVVLKRGRGTGFAGIENELFYKDNTLMLFGDAKDSLAKLAEELKKL
ncbi:MAG: NAD(P)(+) transhydrogenase (Re/Si-specific) subunit beta [Clostridia bacterium]|nr:NAD(P)(+) transhydrogenase (Re/Si-specific) subunit beta [Clostridia bacterium]